MGGGSTASVANSWLLALHSDQPSCHIWTVLCQGPSPMLVCWPHTNLHLHLWFKVLHSGWSVTAAVFVFPDWPFCLLPVWPHGYRQQGGPCQGKPGVRLLQGEPQRNGCCFNWSSSSPGISASKLREIYRCAVTVTWISIMLLFAGQHKGVPVFLPAVRDLPVSLLHLRSLSSDWTNRA